METILIVILSSFFALVSVLVISSLRDKTPASKKEALEETRIESPVQADIKDLETKMHRQVKEIQEIVGSPVPAPACPPKNATERRKPEHDTRMIRLVEEKSDEVQRLAEESR